MEWNGFYNSYSRMTDVDLRGAVISLDDIGSGEEVTDVLTDINNAEIRLRLFDKAVELGAIFTEGNFVLLNGEIPSALLVNLARYGSVEFGMGEDVAEAIESISDDNLCRTLYERAYIEDVRFTSAQLERMGYENIDSAHDSTLEEKDPEIKRCGCLLALIGFDAFFGKRGKNNKNNKKM